MVHQARLDQTVEFKGYLPHRESIALLIGADLLWLVIDPSEGKTVATGKLYEYLGAKKPILANVPEDGAAARLINETKTGVVISFNDTRSIVEYILACYKIKIPVENDPGSSNINISSYNRMTITYQLSVLLDSLIKKNA